MYKRGFKNGSKLINFQIRKIQIRNYTLEISEFSKFIKFKIFNTQNVFPFFKFIDNIKIV